MKKAIQDNLAESERIIIAMKFFRIIILGGKT